MPRAMWGHVAGARHFRELVAWQVSRELARAVYRLTDRSSVRREFAFRDQLNDDAASVAELENHLEDGVDRNLFARGEIEEALALCRRAGSQN